MKKQPFPLLICVTAAFFFFTLGFFLGRNTRAGNLSIEAAAPSVNAATESTGETQTETTSIPFPININTAGVEALTALPGIDQTQAQKIIDYRESTGRFSSAKELLRVPGIGEKTFYAILDYITIGG